MELFKSKVCTHCHTEKPLTVEFFNKNQHTWYSKCRDCRKSARNRDYNLRGRTSVKIDPTTPERLRRFGLTVEAHRDLLKRQNQQCGICKEPVSEKSPIDHCHETGKVRGILCVKCNNGLGAFRDDDLLLTHAARWVRAPKFRTAWDAFRAGTGQKVKISEKI